MKIYIDHSQCARSDAVNDLCFAQMVRRGEWPDHSCIVKIEEEEKEEITFTFEAISGTIEVTLEELREELKNISMCW